MTKGGILSFQSGPRTHFFGLRVIYFHEILGIPRKQTLDMRIDVTHLRSGGQKFRKGGVINITYLLSCTISSYGWLYVRFLL